MATIPDELRERIRSYLAHQAAKEPAAIKAIVQQGHDRLLGLIDGLSEQQARFKPAADDWSVLEVLQHVVWGKRDTARICAALARGQTPAGSGDGGDRRTGVPSSLAEAQSALEVAHEELLAFVDALSPEANVEVRFDHPFFGPLNCREWAVFQRVHDGDHAQQIEQIKASPGFPAT